MSGKAQFIRLLDVFAIGPVMIYGGWKLYQNLPAHERVGLLLTALGVGTILYNGNNYLKAKKG